VIWSYRNIQFSEKEASWVRKGSLGVGTEEQGMEVVRMIGLVSLISKSLLLVEEG
jgi:hypothetical protein